MKSDAYHDVEPCNPSGSQHDNDLSLCTIDGLNQHESQYLFNTMFEAQQLPLSDDQQTKLIEKGSRGSEEFIRSPASPGPA